MKNKELIFKIVKDKRFIYMATILILVMFVSILNVAFSAFTASTSDESHNVKLKQISYKVKSKNILSDEFNDEEIYEFKNGTEFLDLDIKNEYNLELKYELSYDICVDDTCNELIKDISGFNITYLNTLDNVSGIINTNENKTIRLFIDNNKSHNVFIKFKVNSGFVHNELKLDNKIIKNEEEFLLEELLETKNTKVFNNNLIFTGTNKTNNNLIYSNIKWKIIRVNEDNTIKLLYNGLCEDNVCDVASFNDEEYKIVNYNNKLDDVKYVSLTYKEEETKEYKDLLISETDSNIKQELNLFFNEHLEKAKQISDTPFCSNREITNSDKETGFGTLNTEFTSSVRLTNQNKPSLFCREEDKYSVLNKKLDNPIGLITADEAYLIGLDLLDENDNYLNISLDYFTMTPYNYLNDVANVFVISNKKLVHKPVDNSFGNEVYLRPVININNNVLFTGEGTEEKPYIVLDN